MYAVIESTPGYMPEDDDPATFEDRSQALVCLSDQLSRYLDYLYDAGIEFEITQGDDWYFVTRLDSEHDLGRLLEVVEYHDDPDA